MKLLVINNLSAGYGDGSIYDFVRAIAQDGDEICLRCTDGTTPLDSMLGDAHEFDAVVASGGDGTLASVCYLLANTGIPVLPFPAGTANLLALNLEAPNETHALAKLLREGRTLDFDLGEIDLGSKRYGFAIMAGAGYDAAIMQGAEPSKKIFGPMAYFSAALANATPQVSKITIEIDGRTYESEGLGILAVNFSKIQFDLSVTHNNQPRDGALDLVVLKGKTAFDLIPALGAAWLDRGGDFPDRTDSLEIHTAQEAFITADPPMSIQFDGETLPLTTPFKLRVLPRAARIIVSEAGYERFSDN